MKKYLYKQKRLILLAILMNTLAAGMMVYIAIILRDIFDVAFNLDLEGFRSLLIFSAVYFPLFGSISYLTDILNVKLSGRIIQNVREDVFKGMMRQEMSQFKSVNSADYISALTNDINLLEENYLGPLLNMIFYIGMLIMAIALMLYLSPIVTIAFMGASLVFLVIIPGLFGRGTQKRQEKLSSQLSRFTVKIKDIFSGFDVIKSYQMNKHVEKDFQNQNEEVFKSSLSLGYLAILAGTISMLSTYILQIGIMLLSTYLIIQGNLTIGVMMALVQVSNNITSPVQVITMSILSIIGSKPIIERLEEFTNLNASNRGDKMASFEDTIVIKNLEYTYPKQEKPVLRSLSFTFEKNKKYALVGKSGCGKTTLIKALVGHLNDYQGDIFYDEVNLKEISDESTGKISAIIHQNIYMFDKDIEYNICLHESYTEKEMLSIIEDSGVSLFLNEDKTLKTEVGENGSNLSGGQRQRIAVARALIQKKPLLIMDEGTSAIDKQTAKDIETRLLRREDITLITITHLLDTEALKNYDEIIYMEEGVIVEHGSLDSLIKLEGKFSQYISS